MNFDHGEPHSTAKAAKRYMTELLVGVKATPLSAKRRHGGVQPGREASAGGGGGQGGVDGAALDHRFGILKEGDFRSGSALPLADLGEGFAPSRSAASHV